MRHFLRDMKILSLFFLTIKKNVSKLLYRFFQRSVRVWGTGRGQVRVEDVRAAAHLLQDAPGKVNSEQLTDTTIVQYRYYGTSLLETRTHSAFVCCA